MKPLRLILIGVIFSALTGCKKEKTGDTEPKEETPKLATTLAMEFEKTSLNGFGFNNIVFTADGRAAALSVRKEVFFSNNNGTTWELVRKYSISNNDTLIQSLALHPTQDIIFLGGRFLHNFNSYPRHLIIKKNGLGKWDNHIIVTPRYRDQQSNNQYIPSTYQYNHSFWFKNYVINSFSNNAKNDGFVTIQHTPEITSETPAQTLVLPISKNKFVSHGVIPVYDGFDKLFNCSGYEILASGLAANAAIHQWHNLNWMASNTSDNGGKPACCIPNYMSASPNLALNKFNKLMLYSSLGKLYHTHIRPGGFHQQEIIIPKNVVGTQYLCVGIDTQGHVWIGTANNGMFRSTTPLP